MNKSSKADMPSGTPQRPTVDLLDPSFPLLVRTARSVLGWSQIDLATRSGVSEPSVSRLERYDGPGRFSTLQKIEDAFFKAGIVLVQDKEGFGLKITGDLAKTLRSDIRAHQTSTGGAKVSTPGKARVRTRQLDLSDPPEVSSGKGRGKRNLTIDDGE
jgi:transcriptional regulator with XRE-family HTH domain